MYPKLTISVGMANHFLAGQSRIKMRCGSCGLAIPLYRGRYPQCCPTCGESLLSVTESCQEGYLNYLIESFLLQELYVGHTHREHLQANLLRHLSSPFLHTLYEGGALPQLYEVFYYQNFSPNRTPRESDRALLEAALEQNDDVNFAYLGAKALGIYPRMLLDEAELDQIWAISSKLVRKSPSWLVGPGLPVSALAEGYALARLDSPHEEALDFATEVALVENMWMCQIPPSSMRNTRGSHDLRSVVGGFRFHISKDGTKKRMKLIRRRIQSKRNRGGLATRVASAKTMLQRQKALRKAREWHVTSPQSGRMHLQLGKHLHRSNGKYESTSDGYARMRHLRESEMSLRLYTNGDPYHSGPVYQFAITGPLLESQIHRGSSYSLQNVVRTVSGITGTEPVRLEAGTQLKVTDLTPAAQWKGEYPNPPIGQYVVEVEVLSGQERGSFLEIDGGDLAIGLGINEGLELHVEVIETTAPTGAVYVRAYRGQIQEVVIAAHDHLLSEKQIGSILRAFRSSSRFSPDTIIRVYNDAQDLGLLQEELELSRALIGRSTSLLSESRILLEGPKDVERMKIRNTAKNEIMAIKEKMKVDRERLKQAQSADKAQRMQMLKDQYGKEIKRINLEAQRQLQALANKNENVYAGGPGEEVLEQPIRAMTAGAQVVHLKSGTRVSRGTGELLVLSGEYQGQKVRVLEHLVRQFDSWALQRIHEHYVRIADAR